jgi:hypothetical protein
MKKGIVVCLVLLIAGLALAQDKKDMKQPPSKDDMAKMMAAYEKLATPGPEHAALGKMAGDWDVAVKMWMDPKQPAQESKGTCTEKSVLGGRYMQSDFHGMMMGKPYNGVGLDGFDNVKKQYSSVWIDDMGTQMMVAMGTPSADGKTITYTGKMDDPIVGQMNKDIKFVVTLVDDKTHKMEMYDAVGTPNEYKIMELTYTKK